MMPRLITVLEDNVRYRDGKKWKQRYCMLKKTDSKTGNIVMYITKQFGACVPNKINDEKSSRQYLIDDITGFEYGRHVDKEGSVMALIGRNVIYCIAFAQNETMFRWAETLNKYFQCSNFHVTLKKVSETSGLFNKITSGIQGNLHVQSLRLCLIGEPADGNKFICEWPIESISSIDIFNTDSDKVKELVIKSNGKCSKGKGNFEFEISFNQNSVFNKSFEFFLKSCQNTNEDFKTNFTMAKDSVECTQDNTFSYSILYQDLNCSNSDNSSSLEKRSSEIPIPRSREHSGPDQRPIDNVQTKIRKSNKKNFSKVLNENKKHFSLIETSCTFDNNACLFDDDEGLADQVDNKSRNFLCNGLSQESSGVYVNGASSSTRETNLSANILVHNDSGCGNLSSTSSTHNEVINLPNVLPPSHRICDHKGDVFLSFYRNIHRNPLLLLNYKKYNQLLKAVSDNQCQVMKRSNSFNCVHLTDKPQMGYSRKYSQSNFPLNLNYELSDRHFSHWKKKIAENLTEHYQVDMSTMENNEYSKNVNSSRQLLSNHLPFLSVKEFHNSIMKSMQNGTACLNLFCYYHFLMLLNDLKINIRNVENKLKSTGTFFDQNKIKINFNKKQNIYNRWLEKVQSEYCKSFDVDIRSKRASIFDINRVLIHEIARSILLSTKCHTVTNESCDSIPRHHSYYMTNPTIELHDDKCLLKRVDENNFDNSHKPTLIYPAPGLVLCTSSSTPDFRSYNQANQIPQPNKKEKEIKYQNLSAFDTMNHTFPKQNMPLNKSESSENKGGSFKKFRRKYSPGFLMPFLHFGSSKLSNTMFTRRKTPSTHSTLSEPICNVDNKDQNNYYNILHQKQSFAKRSLSVVLDTSCPYDDSKECHNYINVQNNKKLLYKPDADSSNYIYSGPSSIVDDISYPEEILDPSRNYGKLHFIKSNCSKMKYFRQDSGNQNLLNFRRSSLSILSNKSLQNFGISRPTSFKKHGYSNISHMHSDISSMNNNANANISSDYVNGNNVNGSSPQSSTLSCSSGSAFSPYQRVVPKSLNYVTVMENNYSHPFSRPLSICPPNDTSVYFEVLSDLDSSKRIKAQNFKNKWMTPQSSPVVDYCQIDLTGTYVLRDLDKLVLGKMTTCRDKDSFKNGSPDDMESCFDKSFDQTDNYSISSACMKERKNKTLTNKRCFRWFFSRKAAESTN